jgi:polynucleotide 5'-kinase involved in rRNA processing
MRSLLLPTLLAINRSSSFVLQSCVRKSLSRTQHWQRFCAMSTTSEHSSIKSTTKVLGLIGGIASGKSTVAKVLSE